MSINLPAEILSIIFCIHVYVNLESKRTILRTCRKWFEIIVDNPMLWTDISWGMIEGKVHIHDVCRTLADLARDIGRTKQKTFDLTLECPARRRPDPAEIQAFNTSIEDNKWTSRCRSLRIYGCGGPIPATIGPILLQGNNEFTALEHLGFDNTGGESWGPFLDTFMLRVAESSTKLYSLELHEGITPEVAERVFKHVDILPRIRRLDLSSVHTTVPWALFSNLEHLDYARNRYSDFGEESVNLGKLVAPGLTSLCLEGGFGKVRLPPRGIFHQLTHLILKNFTSRSVTNATAFPPNLPNLSSLSVQSSSVLPVIRAENLDELTLSMFKGRNGYAEFANASLKPRILHLVTTSLKVESECTASGEPLPLWSHVQEMHIQVNDDQTSTFGRRLRQALFMQTEQSNVDTGPSYRECYPQIRVLTVLYPYVWKAPSKSAKRGTVDILRILLEAREKTRLGMEKEGESGFQRLEIVKVGWCCCTRGFVGRPSTEWQVTEWRNCLEDWNPCDNWNTRRQNAHRFLVSRIVGGHFHAVTGFC